MISTAQRIVLFCVEVAKSGPECVILGQQTLDLTLWASGPPAAPLMCPQVLRRSFNQALPSRSPDTAETLNPSVLEFLVLWGCRGREGLACDCGKKHCARRERPRLLANCGRMLVREH